MGNYRMAKSLRSKRMRRNRALQAEKKAPRVLQRMKDAMAAGKKHNDMVAAEKAKTAAAQEMQAETEEERVTETAMAQDVPEEKQLNVKTGLNNDGSCPEWMNQKKFKKVKSKLKAKVNKFTPNKYGLGPHKKVLRTAKKGKAKK